MEEKKGKKRSEKFELKPVVLCTESREGLVSCQFWCIRQPGSSRGQVQERSWGEDPSRLRVTLESRLRELIDVQFSEATLILREPPALGPT